MGMYDEVRFRCPKCNDDIIEQTKDGPCYLHTYEMHDAPPEVIGGFDGQDVYCPTCNRSWTVGVKTFVYLN